MIADHDLLTAVTGRRRPHAIRRWLERERIPFLVGADGWPKVLQSLIVARLGGQSAPAPEARPQVFLRNRSRAG